MRRWRFSIAFRLALWVLAITAVFAGAVLVGVLYDSYRLELRGIEENAREIERIHVPLLATAVWDYADDQVTDQVDALQGIRHVRYVELSTEAGTTRSGERLREGAVSRRYPLVHPMGGQLGTLTVQFSLASVWDAVWGKILVSSFFVFLPFGIFGLVTLLVFRWVVTRHLDALAEYSRGLTVETLDRRFSFDRRATPGEDELDRLLHAFDDMRTNLRREIAERKAMEAQMRQAQKLESIGRLAGGIAHDFNNLLTGIMGAAELIGLSENEDVKGPATMILTTAERAATLTSKLLAFSRKGKVASINVEVHRVIQDVVDILERSIDKRILIETRPKAERSWVVGDPAQLESSILNVVLNARDAMPTGGRIVIATDNVEITEGDQAASSLDLRPGTYLDILIRDTGEGMDDEVLGQVFEPFFTTKDVGKGTGLGLPAVYGTMKEHGGAVTIESEVGHGTTCHLMIPVGPGENDQPASEVEAHRGEGRILVIDDDEIIRLTVSRRLTMLGYEVVTASDGVEGVAVYRELGDTIHLVIVDIMMPRMGGTETIQAIRGIHADARILVASGFAPDDAVQALIREFSVGFLQKPFRLVDLAEAVATIMSGRDEKPVD